METKYTIHFVRPVFEKLAIDVTASCEEEAILNAVHTLITDPAKETQWAGKFDESNYTGFVETVDAHDTGEPVEKESIDDMQKFVILQANLLSGEGDIIPQPWLSQQNPFMNADLCHDWSSQLNMLQQDGLEEYVKALRPGKSAKIIPFPNPNKKPEH